jgi:hypothetical protein
MLRQTTPFNICFKQTSIRAPGFFLDLLNRFLEQGICFFLYVLFPYKSLSSKKMPNSVKPGRYFDDIMCIYIYIYNMSYHISIFLTCSIYKWCFSMISHEINPTNLSTPFGQRGGRAEKPAVADQDEGRTSLPGRWEKKIRRNMVIYFWYLVYYQ